MNIALLGAECTGKTRLAQALLQRLQAEHPQVQWVAEYLREWCDSHGRTPRADEQSHIARTQYERVLAASATANPVLCDTTPLITAVYSDVLFGDASLYPKAVEQQRAFGLTLVCGLDLPWEGDGIQRGGVEIRARVDRRLREVLLAHGLGFSSVYGQGAARTEHALQAITYALGKPRASGKPSRWKWACDKCSDPDCEHRLFSDLQKKA